MAITRREALTAFASLIASAAVSENLVLSGTKRKQKISEGRLPAGVVTAALTPLDKNLNPDYPMLVKHLNWLFAQGNDGIGLLGTTGEANSFSVDERTKILDKVIEAGISPVKLLVGTGCSSVTDTISLTRHAVKHNVGGVLLLPPFYYKTVTDAALETYINIVLDKVADQDIQVYLYHYPQLAGIPWNTKVVERLVSKYPRNILGMKDSGGDWKHMEEVLKAIPGFRLYTGTEKYLLPALKAGGAGTISASTNLFSPEAAGVYKAWLKGGGDDLQPRLTLLRETLEVFPFIGAMKYIFAKWTGQESWLNIRPPNSIITPDEIKRLEQKFKDIGYSKVI
jgi:4-hydroxy-tetrahydrodipicolinate synthase